MKPFILELDLLGALALFNHIQERSPSGNCPDLDRLEADLRLFLYDELSIEEMENPGNLEKRLRTERKEREDRE